MNSYCELCDDYHGYCDFCGSYLEEEDAVIVNNVEYCPKCAGDKFYSGPDSKEE